MSALLAAAPAAASAKPVPFPKIRSVSPLQVSVDQTMTIRGSGADHVHPASGRARL